MDLPARAAGSGVGRQMTMSGMPMRPVPLPRTAPSAGHSSLRRVISERLSSSSSFDEDVPTSLPHLRLSHHQRLRHHPTHTAVLSPPAPLSTSTSTSTQSDVEQQEQQQHHHQQQPSTAADVDPTSMFARRHVNKWNWQLALWAPFGCILAVFRLACWVLGVLIDAPWFRNRGVVSTYLNLLGFKVKWKNLHLLPQRHHVMVSNHTTPADLQMLFQLPQRYVHLITTAAPKQTCDTKNLPVILRPACADMYEQLAREITAAGPDAPPVHVFPEGGLTNGTAMMQFARGFMKFVALGTPVVPVALRAKLPWGINPHTLNSSFLANLFWVSFVPFVHVEAVVLPPTSQREGESRAGFVQRVQQMIADELRIPIADGFGIQQKRHLMREAAAKQRGGRRR